MTLQLEQSLDHETSERNFQRDIDAITNRQLSPENIDTYAEDALDDLVSVVERAVASYRDNPTHDFGTGKDREIAGLRYFGLDADTVEQQLDHIADVADEIRELDKVIDEIRRRTDRVIVPPNSDAAKVITGEGGFEKKQVMPRLKTLLFVLSNDFGVDLHDEQQVRVTTGALRDSMMRRESYNFVEIPALNRTVLVCDEEGNITYVFHDEALRVANIETTDIDSLSKTDLNDLLKGEPTLGSKIRYSNRYVQNMTAALGQDEAEVSGRYLQNIVPAPDGYRSAYAIRVKLGINSKKFESIVADLSPELGEVCRYKFRTRKNRPGYSPEQQAMIEMSLEDRRARQADESIQSLTIMQKDLGVSVGVLTDAIKSIKTMLGDIDMYRFGENRKPAYGYLPEQREIIKNYLRSIGKL